MHGTTRGTSINSSHACLGGAGTSNQFSSFTPAPRRTRPRSRASP
jgi:hypothetical protein